MNIKRKVGPKGQIKISELLEQQIKKDGGFLKKLDMDKLHEEEIWKDGKD